MGAGPAGLCPAYVLSKAGVPAVVLEKAPFAGGLARTIMRQTHLGESTFDIVARGDLIGGFAAPRASPSYVLGYEAPLEVTKRFIAGFGNLQIIGRYGTFRYNNTDHSIETGLLAAKNLLGEHNDLDRVNADQEYHEMKRVTQAPGNTSAG
jgi:protoporphyrinogen oxidase